MIVFLFSVKERFLWVSNDFLSILAPGSYDIEKGEKTVHQASPAYSIGKKYKDKKPEDVPGQMNAFLLFCKSIPIK